MKISISPSLIIYSIIAIAIVTISIVYYRHEKMCEKNVLNCEKITLGMSLQTVTQIMGEPRDINTLTMEAKGQLISATQYCYEAPADSKKGVYVYIDATTYTVFLAECKE